MLIEYYKLQSLNLKTFPNHLGYSTVFVQKCEHGKNKLIQILADLQSPLFLTPQSKNS